MPTHWLPPLITLGLLLIYGAVRVNIFGAKTRISIVTAIRNLWLHKLRSFLSVLGIIIGTSAVISLMAFGEGSMQDALEDIKRQGATNIIAMSVKPPEDGASTRRSFVAKYGLTDADFDRFQKTIPNLVSILPMRIFAAEVRPVVGSRMAAGRVVGTTAQYHTVYKLKDRVEVGRFIEDEDEFPFPRNVCVLGSEIAKELFPGEDPLNKSIKFSGKDRAFHVIGVLKDRSPNTSGAEIEKYNSDVYIPLAASRSLLGETTTIRSSGMRGAEQVNLHQIVLTVQTMEQVRPTADQVRHLLELYHDRNKKDWDIKVPLDKLEEAERTRDRFTQLMAGIASISLLVGGIGIMNIMLATVTERTREIGIRRALGAKRGDITFQFLVEAVVQTTVGGLIGVALGFAIIFAVPALAERFGIRMPATVHVPSIFLSFFVAVAVGVLFGWYPSRRAANLDPIEALRHE
jgi:putative ABC transport system permease protein